MGGISLCYSYEKICEQLVFGAGKRGKGSLTSVTLFMYYKAETFKRMVVSSAIGTEYLDQMCERWIIKY